MSALGGIEYDRVTGEVTELVLIVGERARQAWIHAAPPGRVRTEKAGRTVKNKMHWRSEGRRPCPLRPPDLASVLRAAKRRGGDGGPS